MELDLLRLHHEVDVLAGGQVEVGGRRGGDVGGQSGAADRVGRRLGPGRWFRECRFRRWSPAMTLRGLACGSVEVDGHRGGPKQRDRRIARIERPRSRNALCPKRFGGPRVR